MTRNRRGAGLMDALVSIFLLGTAGIVFSASFPSGFAALQQSCEATKATAVAQQKLEQIRSLDYDKLEYEYLFAGGIVDMYPESPPDFSFTEVDAELMDDLREPTGTLTITEDEENVKQVVVSLSWESGNGIPRNVTLTTLVADCTPWVRD